MQYTPSSGGDGENTRAVSPPETPAVERPMRMPVHRATTYAFDSTQEFADVINGSRAGYSYGRFDNPTADAFAEAVAALGEHRPRGLLVFDCAGRRAVLKAELADEYDRMRSHVGDAPVAGFYGNGEIARVHGALGFHNQTIVACALG